MNGIEEYRQPTVNDRYKEFSLIEYEEDWDGAAKYGIPLLGELVELGDTERAGEVRKALQRTLQVIENSGAGNPESNKALAEKIKAALK